MLGPVCPFVLLTEVEGIKDVLGSIAEVVSIVGVGVVCSSLLVLCSELVAVIVVVSFCTVEGFRDSVVITVVRVTLVVGSSFAHI